MSLLKNQTYNLNFEEMILQWSILETLQQKEKTNKRIHPESSQTISDMEESENSKRPRIGDQSKDKSKHVYIQKETSTSETRFSVKYITSIVPKTLNVQEGK